MINLILVIISRVVFLFLEPLSFVYVVFFKERFTWKRFNGYCKSSAVNLDRFGNYEFRSLFNFVLIKSWGYQFGKFEETISSVMGKNERLSYIRLDDLFIWYPTIEFQGRWYKWKFCLRKKVIIKYRRFVSTPYTKTGVILNRILNFIDRDHCIRSIHEI